MLHEGYLQYKNPWWENLFQNRSVQDRMFCCLQKYLGCFYRKFTVCTGAHPKKKGAKQNHTCHFLHRTCPNKKYYTIFSPMTQQADGIYRINYKRVWRVPVTFDTQSHLKCLKQVGLQWDQILTSYGGRHSQSRKSSQKCSQQKLNGQWEKASTEVTSFCSQTFDSPQLAFPVEMRPS